MSEPTVPIRLPDGTAGTVPASQVAQLPEGTTRMSAEEVAEEKRRIALDKKFGGVEGKFAAATTSAASGLSAGLFDVLASYADPATGKAIKEAREANPMTSAAGELVGMGVGMALTGGAAGAAEGAAATALGGGTLARVAASGLRGATEFGLYEAGKSAGDQALEGKPVDYEKVAAALGHGMTLGGGFSAGASILGAGISRLVAGRGAQAVERAVAGEAGTVARAGEEAAAKEVGGLRKTLATKAQESADEFFGQSLGASKNQIKIANRNVEGGLERIARDVKGELREEFGTSILPGDRKALADGVESAIERRAAERAEMLAKADKAGTAIAPTAENVVRAIEERFVAANVIERAGQLVPKFGKEAEVAAAQNVIERLRSGFGDAPTFKDWARSITDLGKEARFDKLASPIAADVKKQVYGMMSEELGRAMDLAAPQLGTSLSAEYRANGKVMESLFKARDMLETGLAKDTRNNAFGLTSRIAGIAGGVVGGVPGMLVSAGVGKVLQDRGAMLASDLLERAAGALGARRIAARTEAQMAKGVAELTGAAKAETFGLGSAPFRAPAIVAGRLTAKNFPEVRKSVERANADPSVIADAVQQQVGNSHPKLTQAVTQTMVRGAQYLATKLPPSKADPYAVQPQFDDADRMSDAERSAFLRAAEAVSNPTMILEEARKGTLTRDHVEAVKAVYPALYEEMRAQVLQSLVDSKTRVPYSRRIQLGILLDIPTDKTLSPEFLSAIQGTYAQGAGEAESPPPALSRPINVANSLETPMQSVLGGAE